MLLTLNCSNVKSSPASLIPFWLASFQSFTLAVAGIGRIGDIELAIGIAIEVSQRFKAIRCYLASAQAAGEDGVVTEEFAPGVDFSIAVQVPHDDGFARGYPAGGGFDAGALLVKKDGCCGVDGAGRDAITVQVQD